MIDDLASTLALPLIRLTAHGELYYCGCHGGLSL